MLHEDLALKGMVEVFADCRIFAARNDVWPYAGIFPTGVFKCQGNWTMVAFVASTFIDVGLRDLEFHLGGSLVGGFAALAH